MSEKELTKNEKIQLSIDSLKSKSNKLLFVVGATEAPNASTYEIYRHATEMKNNGFNVTMLTDVNDYVIPEWIESEMTDIKHESIEKTRISIGPEDILIIPETFTNVMEQTKNLPCLRVGLLQSIDYTLNALVPGTDWGTFGINDVITTSNSLKTLVDEFFNNRFDVKVVNPIIPDYFFNADDVKKPVISIVGRNANEIAKVIKLFYAKYPHFKWLTFDTMYTQSNPPQPLNRKDFAERLQGNLGAVWVDRISSFGTFPLECMASGAIPIGLIPDIMPEYLISENDDKKNLVENSGYWSTNIYDIPLLINQLVTESLDDVISDEYISKMSEIPLKYKASNNKESILNVYTSLMERRSEVLENAIKGDEKLNNIDEKNTENE